ncbi:MAG: hypothetical protein ACKO5A_06565 [Actinomycetota bacterium]
MRVRLLVAGLAITAVAAACAAPAPVPPGPGALTPTGKATLTQLKRSHFGALAQEESARIGAGLAQPLAEFSVVDSPPSIFVNWTVPDAQAAAFEAVAPLPPGFTLAKVRIIESDPVPRYWLSLNVYRVSGLTTGLRAEWSTYVDDGDGVPRFMILKARAAEGSLDPIGPLALPEPFEHSVVGSTIQTSMKDTVLQNGVPVLTPDNLFTSTIALPAPADRVAAVPTREWVTANDFIFWRNGVNDRIFHNSSSHSAPLISVDPAAVTLDDHSPWAPFLDPAPAHVLVYLDAIDFVISPWWNVTALDGNVDALTLANLGPLKASLYSGLSSTLALGVLTGTGEPAVRSRVEADPAAVHWHWQVPPGHVAALAAAAGLPPGLDPAPVALEEGDAPAYWITLTASQRSGDGAGTRAEWTTYVDDGDGVRTLVLESRSSTGSLDPVDLFSAPFPVTHSVGATATSTVGTGGAAFTSSFAVPAPTPANAVLADRRWVGTMDLRYWRNGVADRVTYESTVFDARTAIDPATATIAYGGQWAAFADATPDRIWVDRSGVDVVTNPWWNLGGL